MSKKNNPADKVEQWPIEKLVPYAKNSRTHSEDQIAQLAASIKEWGFTSAILGATNDPRSSPCPD
jgi:ParB-like chromosome segregation protein Spo0J